MDQKLSGVERRFRRSELWLNPSQFATNAHCARSLPTTFKRYELWKLFESTKLWSIVRNIVEWRVCWFRQVLIIVHDSMTVPGIPVGSRRVTNRNWTLPKITHGCCWSGGDLGGLVRNICYILLLHISDLNVMASPTSTERYCLGWVCWARMRRVKRKMTPTPLEKIKIYTLYIYSHYIPLLLNICIIYPIISLVVKNGDNFCEALRVPNCMLTLGQFSALPNARHQVSPNHLVSKDVGWETHRSTQMVKFVFVFHHMLFLTPNGQPQKHFMQSKPSR